MFLTFLASNACPFNYILSKMDNFVSCRMTAVTNYLNEVLPLSSVPNAMVFKDEICAAEISQTFENGEKSIQLQPCIAALDDNVGVYCISKESISEILVSAPCRVS